MFSSFFFLRSMVGMKINPLKEEKAVTRKNKNEKATAFS
jgi:hypothetical protein